MFHKGLNEPEAGWPLVTFDTVCWNWNLSYPCLTYTYAGIKSLNHFSLCITFSVEKNILTDEIPVSVLADTQNCCFKTLFMVHWVMCVSNSYTPEPSETLTFELGAFNGLNVLFIRRTLHLFSSEAALIVALFQQRAVLPLASVCLR